MARTCCAGTPHNLACSVSGLGGEPCSVWNWFQPHLNLWRPIVWFHHFDQMLSRSSPLQGGGVMIRLRNEHRLTDTISLIHHRQVGIERRCHLNSQDWMTACFPQGSAIKTFCDIRPGNHVRIELLQMTLSAFNFSGRRLESVSGPLQIPRHCSHSANGWAEFISLSTSKLLHFMVQQKRKLSTTSLACSLAACH